MTQTPSKEIKTLIVLGCLCLTAAKLAPQGKTYYTKVNIWYETPGRILSTNYHKGGRIPAGTEVKILNYGHGKITFFDAGTGVMTLWHARRHSRITLDELFNRHFSEENVRAAGGKFEKMTGEEQKNIEAGVVANGMSKDAVVMAYGYPPSHRTPSVKVDRWIYWIGKHTTKIVNFNSEGRVGQNKVAEEKEEAEKAVELNPVGKEYFTRINIWHDKSRDIPSLNYHAGTRIPVGTKVKITSFGNDIIAFDGGEVGSHRIVHSRRHRNITLQELFTQYFSANDVNAKDGALSKLTEAEQASVKAGRIALGMGKEAVLMGFGYPPDYMTPDLQHHIWKYWIGRVKLVSVYFRDEKVHTIDPPPEEKSNQ